MQATWKNVSRRLVMGLAALAAGLFSSLSTGPSSLAAAGLTLDPTSAVPNQAITVTGSAFTKGGGVTISSVALDGVAVPADKFNFGASTEVDSGGAFVATLVVPVNSRTLTPGGHTLTVTDSSGGQGSATLTIPTPTVSVSPASSRAGTEVTVSGSNFPLNRSSANSDQVPTVNIKYEATGLSPRTVVSAVPNSSGALSATFQVPMNTPVNTENIVRVSVTGSASSYTAKHKVPDSTIAVTPASGSPGASATIKGSNFKAFVPISALSLGGIDVSSGDPVHTDGNGSFSVAFTVPLLDNGAHQVSVTVEGKSYIKGFTIEGAVIPTPTPPPPVLVDAAVGFGPLGDSLVRVWSFDNYTKAWAFYDPKPAFADVNTLRKLKDDEVYWIELREDQSLSLNGKGRKLFAGWNVIPW